MSAQVPILSKIESAQIRRLEVITALEATTLILLVGVAVPLKHLLSWPLGVHVLGPLHGVAFLLFLWTALQTVSGGGWAPAEAVRLIGAGLIPFGGYANIRWLRRKADTLYPAHSSDPS